ncbi:hypothetical protein ROJ8625_00560 [Roseivivax jejudonensis]|uniref:Uncharacterized protein n=1 Tax=Roseivivax jejudonensis TaxID=1529041 RepID=A0A1X6YDQ0_9RHOB|nr:hypothetical protein [Roseivivax jejudonensis]SLN17543.1 hypothetical protein ROJ8625_00560 [Roseivivax jejudonensis]
MPSLPPLVAFFVRHALAGFGLAAIFVALLLLFDVAGLWRLISTSPEGMLPLFLLWFFNGIVFAGAQTGARLFLMAESEGHGGGGGTPVPVRAEAASSHRLGSARL